MGRVTSPANADYDFGQDFNYAVWTQGTQVTLTNVPWNNDTRDVVHFPLPNGVTLNQYIDSTETDNIEINNMSYLKFGQPVLINIPFNRAFKYNYIRVNNPAQPIPGTDELRTYYYFVLGVEYVSPNTTRLIVQLDVFQSFAGYYTLGNVFIERGHIGIANSKQNESYGRNYLTVPEGIDIGSEYQQVARKTENIIDNRGGGFLNVMVLVVSTLDLNQDGGTTEAPEMNTAKGSNFESLPSGASYYVFNDITRFKNFLSIRSDQPWITQGIISITLIPRLDRYDTEFWDKFDMADFNVSKPVDISQYVPGANVHRMYEDWRNSDEILEAIPERWRHLKKLFTYPYMAIEMTTFSGNAIVIKPESWNDPHATIVERASFTPPNQRIDIYPRRYNAKFGSVIENMGGGTSDSVSDGWKNRGDDGGEYLDFKVMIANFPTLAIVNNGALNYLASQFANISYGQTSADWTQERANRSAQTSYDQGVSAINTSKNINKLGNAGIGASAANSNLLLAQQTAANGLGGVLTAGAGAAVGAGPGGVSMGGPVSAVGSQVMGGINSDLTQANSLLAANATQMVSKGSNEAQNLQAGYVNDTNKDLANFAAKGDYENTIAGIQAMVRGAEMVKPSISGQVGGETINLVNGSFGVSLRWKVIDPSALATVGDYFLRYGYAINRFIKMPSSLRVMSKFSYWKVKELYITSSEMPEGFKQIIRGIFEKGVTVWVKPEYIGNTDIADNVPLEGINY